MSDFDKLREALTSWPCIIIGFCFAGWPGFLLLLWKILHESYGGKTGNMSDSFKRSVFGSEGMTRDMYWDRESQRWVRVDSSKQDTSHTLRYDDPAATYSYSYRDGKPTDSSGKKEKAKKKKKGKKSYDEPYGRAVSFPKMKDGKGFTIAGAITTGIFGLGLATTLVDALSYGTLASDLSGIIALLMFTGIGAGMLLWGRFKNRQTRQFRKLLQLIGDSDRVSLRALSDAAGLSYDKACDLLQTMIDAGYLGYKAYLNLATGELVLDGSPVRTPAPSNEPEPELTAEEDRGILCQIRAANDAIPDEEMSRKISRIEEITGHILDYQEKHPEKASDLRKFLSYYLPTTLKILNTYAELDRQRVSGENINATKKRIEGMMDKVVEGFELQLDKLYENEMLDISSDISVMESMLSQDGLSANDPSAMRIPKAPDGAVAAREAAAQAATRQNAAREAAQAAATAANAAFTTPGGIHLTLDPKDDTAAGGAAAQQSR